MMFCSSKYQTLLATSPFSPKEYLGWATAIDILWDSVKTDPRQVDCRLLNSKTKVKQSQASQDSWFGKLTLLLSNYVLRMRSRETRVHFRFLPYNR